MTTRVYVRNPALERIGELDEWRSLELVLRDRDVSTWVLEAPRTHALAEALAQPGYGIEVVREGLTLLSGPRWESERRWSREEDTLTLAGVDDTAVLTWRLAHPSPADGNPATSAYDVRTGAAEPVLKAYVEANAGPSALPARRVAGLTVEVDQGRGSTITGRARFQRLLELCQSLAVVGGVSFRVVQEGASLVFRVWVPADLTASAIFSAELGNLRGFTYGEKGPDATYAFVAGQGEGIARTFVQVAGDTSVYGRIEAFRDRRDTNDPAELSQAGREALTAGAASATLAVQPIDTPGLAFGRDYNLGDKVTVSVDGVPIRDVVSEVRLKLRGDGGEEITPAVGPAPRADALARIFETLRTMGRRVGNLERR